ncbi:MAG TPA: hypothetical protein VGY55_03085 [Pirellulales bacterium]|jgi:hypothetical protein|nr:hypothetical protein [Pirellulales bacterium]
MSLLRTLSLSIVPVAALALPLATASSAQAHEDHRDHFDRHEQFEHHEFFRHAGPIWAAPVHVGVYLPPVRWVYYRLTPDAPWVAYGSYGDFADAQFAAQQLHFGGFQIVIR